MRVAALTMAYNEPVWARVWARFYAREVGAENCFLLDHGSDDGSTGGLPVRVERLKRSALDEHARAVLVAQRAAELLERYDAVIHSDADELVLADPLKFKSLQEFADENSEDVVTAAGLDVQHLPGEEAALDPALGIGGQRSWLRFSAAMCKPAFVRRRVQWAPGFHSCEAPMQVGPLFLLHLRFADLGLGLRRLSRTREQSFADAETNLHQRVSDEEFAGMMRSIAMLPRETVALGVHEDPLGGWLRRVRDAQEGGAAWLHLAGDRLWRLPEAWRDRF